MTFSLSLSLSLSLAFPKWTANGDFFEHITNFMANVHPGNWFGQFSLLPPPLPLSLSHHSLSHLPKMFLLGLEPETEQKLSCVRLYVFTSLSLSFPLFLLSLSLPRFVHSVSLKRSFGCFLLSLFLSPIHFSFPVIVFLEPFGIFAWVPGERKGQFAAVFCVMFTIVPRRRKCNESE